jgi:hypothetical protein
MTCLVVKLNMKMEGTEFNEGFSTIFSTLKWKRNKILNIIITTVLNITLNYKDIVNNKYFVTFRRDTGKANVRDNLMCT